MSRPFTEIPAFVLGLYTDVREVLFETASRVKDRLSVDGSPIRYPVQWDTERQKRAFFASKGFGNGIPYRRTGRTALAWRLERVALGTNLRNPHPAGAVFGMPHGWQSRIHRGRWEYLLKVLFEELDRIPDRIKNRFTVRADK